MSDFPALPSHLLPNDGRFGSGPSLVRHSQIQALAAANEFGTSHRQAPVISLIESIQEGLTELFSLPDGYEIALGNGGATAFWAIATCSLIDHSAALASIGEFSDKFAQDATQTPWLECGVIEAVRGELVVIDDEKATELGLTTRPDVWAYPHNETSTGVVSPLYRSADPEVLSIVDAVSIGGGIEVDLSLTDAYYFSPQKCFGSDSGLWFAILSPAAIERAHRLRHTPGRYLPQILDLDAALRYSRKGQTVNTPAIATLVMMNNQITWMLSQGGLSAMNQRARQGSSAVHEWTQTRSYAELFVKKDEWRSPTVTTVEIDPAYPVKDLLAILRRAGIVDLGGYPGIGHNQLRIPSFPSIEPADVKALLACIDWVIERW